MIFDARRPVLITGGAGFIGTNLADHLLVRQQPVLVYDSLRRVGSEHNLRWLRERHGDGLDVVLADVRDEARLTAAVRQCCRVFHLAAQVAVTTSLIDPREDFAVNAGGTLALLEAIRACPTPPPLVYTSTNKVYGDLADLALIEVDGRYAPLDPVLRARGVGERQPLDFHSPYGCSKGAADQYVLDYARVFDLPALVFRMSCIYGPHQRGNEDQGWVAHFALRALAGAPITIYGDGRQVRDLLFVEDLCEALVRAQHDVDRLRGQAFNVGGGPDQAASLLEVVARLETLLGRAPVLDFSPWRPADQRYYVSDTQAYRAATGWRPRVGLEEGLQRLLVGLGESVAEERAAAGRTGLERAPTTHAAGPH